MFIFVALGRAVDGHLEAAMRFARNLALGLDVVERFGHRRWGFAQWDAHHTAEVVRLMETQAAVQLPIEWIAAQMALSVRTLERRLAAENVNYRALQAEMLKGRLKLLLQDPALSRADIAEKLGYSDETALARAARRWYGTTLSRLRKELVRLRAR